MSYCKRFWFGLNHKIKLYLVVQSTEVFDKLVEKTRALEETLGEEPKAILSRAVKWTADATSGSGHKGKRGRFDKYDRRVAGGRG